MAQDLPDDVWSQLAETWLDKRALQDMSLTSRRMHQLAVPVLFRHLAFHIAHEGSVRLIARLIRNIMRARFLFNSPELLRHTRFFSFWQNSYSEDFIAEYLAVYQGSESSSWRDDAENLFAVLNDAIFRLIFRMSGLRKLHISGTVITPLCYATISSRPLLTSLRLEPPRRSPRITYVPPALPYATRLRDFGCFYNTWTGNERLTDPYLTDILDHYILELEKLSLSSNLLPLVVSRIPLNRTLFLRSLSMMFPFYSSDGLAAVPFFQVLRACPQLQHLSLLGVFPDFEPIHYLSPPSLPNLSTFSGPSRLLQVLSGGTNLVNIDIHDNFYVEEQSLTEVILSPPTHLRELSMGFVVFLQTPHELLTFIQSLAVFRNLEKLKIAYARDFSWKMHVTAQDLHSLIGDLLDQLPHMRFLDIHSSGVVAGYDIGCPISEPGEPADRGHPYLEGMYVDFICGRWAWDSRTGWERRDWAMP